MKKTASIFLGIAFSVLVTSAYLTMKASDHDDGENDLKSRTLNLTDVFAFMADWQDSSGNPNNLVSIVNIGNRNLPSQNYPLSLTARYQMHYTRVAAANLSVPPTGEDDVILRFEFGAPDSAARQAITMTVIKDGTETAYAVGQTSNFADNTSTPIVNTVNVEGHLVKVHVGPHEDPFFFDVERYFRARALLAAGKSQSELFAGLPKGPTQSSDNFFKSDPTAVDFAAGYNVNSIVVEAPLALFQSGAGEPILDVWATISVPVP